MRKNRENRFYVYKDKSTGKQYFHNPLTNQMIWCPPENAVILDPETLEKVEIDLSQIRNQIKEREDQIILTPTPQIPKRTAPKLRNSLSTKSITASPKRIRGGRTATLLVSLSNQEIRKVKTSELPIYLPKDILKDKNEYDTRTFAQNYFNVRIFVF